METIPNMRKIIKYFTYKYSGNWEEIYKAIKSKEQIHPLSLLENEENLDKQLGYISIIDDDYPENFKKIYMPPMSIFFFGDKKLLNEKIIISIWGKYKNDELIEFNDKTNNIYAIKFNNDYERIKKISQNGIPLIIVDEDKPTIEKINFLKNINNFCYISEYPLDIDKISKSEEQVFERLLLGVSNYSIFFNYDEVEYKNFIKIHNFEQRNKYFYKTNNEILDKESKCNILNNVYGLDVKNKKITN